MIQTNKHLERLELRPDRLEEVMSRAAKDSMYFAKLFYPERFSRPFDRVHQQMFELIDGPHQLVAMAAPRGMGKTSIANLLTPTKAALFHRAKYIVPVSATADLALQQSENLKEQMLANTKIRSIFGDLTIHDEDQALGYTGNKAFSQKAWTVNVAGTTVYINPRGAGQQVRGMIYGNSRPDLILVDDLERDDRVRSEEQRIKLKEWFQGSLMNTVDGGSRDWRIIFVGTLLHEDSLLQNLLDDPHWDSLRMELCNDTFISNAPNYKTDAECKALYERYKQSGTLDVFFQDFRNLPTATGADAAFPAKFFKSYVPPVMEREFRNDPHYEHILLCDLAKTAKPSSADSALVAVSVNMQTNAIYVRDVLSGKWHYDEILDNMVHMIKENDIKTLGAEITGLGEFASYPIKNTLSREGLDGTVEFIPLHARGGVEGEKGKVSRIRTLQPLYRKGLIFHNPNCCQALEAQLRSFPRSKRWDIMDALGYLPEILEIGIRFMQPLSEHAGDGAFGPAPEIDTFEADMAALDAMDADPVPDSFFRLV